jgi:hypothetical protein
MEEVEKKNKNNQDIELMVSEKRLLTRVQREIIKNHNKRLKGLEGQKKEGKNNKSDCVFFGGMVIIIGIFIG